MHHVLKWYGGKINFFFLITIQLGKTKVFLRAGQMAELDARRTEVLSSAAKIIQQRRRTHIARKRFIALREASIQIQSFCRGETPKTVELFTRVSTV